MDIIVTYRRKKSGISMSVDSKCNVRVSAPLGTPRQEVESFIQRHSLWIEAAKERVTKAIMRRDAFYARLPLDTEQKRQEAIKQLHDLTFPWLVHYSRMMDVRPTKVNFTRTKSRWGSCNSNTKKWYISLSVYLLLMPRLFQEYVVVHELAHLLVPNHGKAFYRVLDLYFPQWKEAEKLGRAATKS